MAAGDKWFDCTNVKKILGLDQLLRLLTVDDGSGEPAIRVYGAVSASFSIAAESTTTTNLIQSIEAAGSQTLAGLNTAYQAWKAAHPSKQVLRESWGTGGDGIPGIFITYIT